MKRTIFILTALAVTAGSALAWTTSGTTVVGGTTMRGVESRLEDAATQVSGDATRVGDATFTERFATEFGVTTDVLTQQQTQYNVTWGELFIAYSIQSASRTNVSLNEIMTLRTSGQTWTQIASSLRIPPGRLLTMVRTDVQTFSNNSPTRNVTRGRSNAHGFGSESGNRTQQSGGTIGVNRLIDTRLQTLDDQLTRLDDATIADRLAQDFGVTTDVLNVQRTQFSAGWSDLLVAYTLMNQSRTTVTIDQIFAMRSSGESWTQIARSLRVPPGTLLRSLRTETQTVTQTDTQTSGTTTLSSKRSGSSGTTSRQHGGNTQLSGTTTTSTTTCGSTGGRTTRSIKGSASMKGVGHTKIAGSMRGGVAMAHMSTTASSRLSTTAATRLSATTLLSGRGAMMRAAARGAMTAHGHK